MDLRGAGDCQQALPKRWADQAAFQRINHRENKPVEHDHGTDIEVAFFEEAKIEPPREVTNAVEIIKLIEEGKIKVVEYNTRLPSPFSFNLVLEGYSDILKMEDRHEFLKRMHQEILKEISTKIK